jgi:hypothetical protein
MDSKAIKDVFVNLTLVWPGVWYPPHCYLAHLNNKPTNTLANMAFKTNIELNSKGQGCWLSNVQRITKALGVNVNNAFEDKSISKSIKNKLKERFRSYWHHMITADEPKHNRKEGINLEHIEHLK